MQLEILTIIISQSCFNLVIDIMWTEVSDSQECTTVRLVKAH